MIARLTFLVFLFMGCVRGNCLKENIRWLSDDILDIQRPITDPFLCQDLCVDLDSCSAFTWTSEDNPDMQLVCLLFSATSNETFCDGCVSGPARCTCSKEEACVAEDNYLDNIQGVLEEGLCQDLCARTPSCMFYTWHDSTSFYSYSCILLTSCDDTESCSGCFSGPLVCSSENPTTTPAPATEGILISGSFSDSGTSVEVFVPSTGHSCLLPPIPEGRFGHTMNSLLICGGGSTSAALTTCISFASGKWITSHQIGGRQFHTSWKTEQGLMLMGGQNGPDTSEIVPTAGGQGEPSFALQYKTEYACSMPDLTSDSVIISGGQYTQSTVSRYGILGWVEDLPSLVEGRLGHGCGSFWNSDNTQVFLVAGGQKGTNNYFSSTEMLTMDSPGWTLTTPLPRAMVGVSGVTVGGRLYISGGRIIDGSFREEILGWLDDQQEWEEIGKMKVAREWHAMSTIQVDDPAMENCS